MSLHANSTLPTLSCDNKKCLQELPNVGEQIHSLRAVIPNFLAPGTSFLKDSFSTDREWGRSRGGDGREVIEVGIKKGQEEISELQFNFQKHTFSIRNVCF